MRRDLDMRESGQVLPLVIVFMLVMFVMLGLVIDDAQAYRARVALRASTDAAALAGAANLPNTATASSAAYAYGAGGKNPMPNVPTVATSVSTTCVANFPGCRPANTVSVTQSADVPTTFLGLIGIKSIHVSATASACSPCDARAAGHHDRARPYRLDVPVLGRHQRPRCTDLNNAKDGIRTFLGLMDPRAPGRPGGAAAGDQHRQPLREAGRLGIQLARQSLRRSSRWPATTAAPVVRSTRARSWSRR